jgi:hypothetical protein
MIDYACKAYLGPNAPLVSDYGRVRPRQDRRGTLGARMRHIMNAFIDPPLQHP